MRTWEAGSVQARCGSPAIPALAAWSGPTGTFAAVGHAGGSFGKPQRLSSASTDYDIQLATDRRGDAIIAWVADNPGAGSAPSKPGPDRPALFVSYRHAGDNFGRAHLVAHDGVAAVVAWEAPAGIAVATADRPAEPFGVP